MDPHSALECSYIASRTRISSTLITRLMLNIRDPKLFELPHRWPSELMDIHDLPSSNE